MTYAAKLLFYGYSVQRAVQLILQPITLCAVSNWAYYRPQTQLRKGNVFTLVCQSFCSRGVSAQCMLGYTPLGRHTPLLFSNTPQPDTTLLGRHPPSRRLLLRTVRILLECIVVTFTFFGPFLSVEKKNLFKSRLQMTRRTLLFTMT